MRRILISGLLAALIVFSSCEQEPVNPGDFTLQPTLEVVQITDTSGTNYPFAIQRSIDTTYRSGKKGKYIELDTILLNAARGEIQIRVATNARWLAPIPDFQGKIAWLQTQISSGAGDGIIKARLSPGLAKARRPILANQYIYTRDSLVMYRVIFNQKAQNE
ncbi:MAG: hypothetical protein LWW91_01410 [Bacteroidales bacterium]|jgi:hypothetical protein|nr:hypothetical protein [Bacteroidales bacterium]